VARDADAATKRDARVRPSITGTATYTHRIRQRLQTRAFNLIRTERVGVAGTYTFSGTSSDYVYVDNATGSCCSASLAVDAVEFVPKSQ
jgi:hypothetical protein